MARFYRTLAGPVLIGVAVWCASGTLAVLSNVTTERLGAPAPWWVFIVAAVFAALVPNWRARPVTAVPALLSTLPWWPVPLPAVALVWTGPMAWVPIGAALFVAHGSRPLAWVSRAVGATDPVRAMRLAAGASILIGVLAAWSADPFVPGGDEPHYLVITQSLLKDGDLKIENNHARRDYASYFGGTIKPDFITRGQNGEIYSIHAPGVSALVLPAFALLGLRGAQATIVFLFGIAGALMWRAAWRLSGDTSAAWFAWAALAGSTTMAVLSFMIFPETPGVCAVAAGVWLLVSLREASMRQIIAVSAALAALPWLHTRFSVLAGLLGLVLISTMLADRPRPVAERWRRALAFMVIPAASAIAWLWMFHALYGVFDPRAPYGHNPNDIRSWIWGAVTGLFVDQQFGLMVYAPVLFAAFMGCARADSGVRRRLCLLCAAILGVYTMAVATYWMWWAGMPGLPARFLTAALPLLALPLAVAWMRTTAAGRSLLLALLLISISTTAIVVGIDRAAMAWNVRDGQAAWLEWLSPVVNLPRAWPSFFWNGEGSFLRHAVVFIASVFVVCVAAAVLARRFLIDQARARTAVALTMVLGLMLIVQAGWTVTDAAPLDSARAQLALYAEAGAPRQVWRIGNGIHRWDAAATPIRIVRDQPSLLDDPTAVLLARKVPAGLYRLEITSGTVRGTVLARLRRNEPLARFEVVPSQPQVFSLVLPAGAAALEVIASSPELAGQLQVTLVPASPADDQPGYARQYRRYPSGEAYFLDDNVFPEGEGFWVRGGRTAELVLSQGSSAANRAGTLSVRNGAAANTVTIRSGAWQDALTLAPGEVRAIALPQANALGAWHLSLTSSSGFRPSDTAGDDQRFLGAWIQLTR